MHVPTKWALFLNCNLIIKCIPFGLSCLISIQNSTTINCKIMRVQQKNTCPLDVLLFFRASGTLNKALESNKIHQFILFWGQKKLAHTQTHTHTWIDCVCFSINRWLAFAFFNCLRGQLSNIVSMLCALHRINYGGKRKERRNNNVKERCEVSPNHTAQMNNRNGNRIKAIQEKPSKRNAIHTRCRRIEEKWNGRKG